MNTTISMVTSCSDQQRPKSGFSDGGAVSGAAISLQSFRPFREGLGRPVIGHDSIEAVRIEKESRCRRRDLKWEQVGVRQLTRGEVASFGLCLSKRDQVVSKCTPIFF